jgi:hypothetical protein
MGRGYPGSSHVRHRPEPSLPGASSALYGAQDHFKRVTYVERQRRRAVVDAPYVAGPFGIVVGWNERESRSSQLARESHRVHRAAADLAADQDDGASVLSLQPVARDLRLLRDSCPRRLERRDGAAGRNDRVFEFSVLWRIRGAEPIADEGYGRRRGRKCAAMRCRVDAWRESGDDRHAESSREIVSKLHSFRRWSPAADDRDAALRQPAA